jgi:hypothetical protein
VADGDGDVKTRGNWQWMRKEEVESKSEGWEILNVTVGELGQ